MRATLPLIGRQTEIEQITERLRNEDCSLLTVFGNGGIGKTHLAIGIADVLAQDFTHGAEIIALQTITNADGLATAICEVLSIPISGSADVEVQLIKALQSLNLLLILDNYEHLLPELTLLTKIMDNAPDVTFLITSREPLQLRGEWLYPLDGLSYPNNVEDVSKGFYDAIELFASCADRVNPQFDTKREIEQVIRICKLVEGLPLGIELAASWLQAFTAREIADEIKRNLDFLHTNLHDVPERHRSLRAVFDQTWSALSDKEKTCFRRSAIFVGGFQRDAAENVTECSWLTLSALSNKMIFQRNDDGRYACHDLLRQYALEKLHASGEYEDMLVAHATYYAQFVADRRIANLGGSQQITTSEVIREFENIRSNIRKILLTPEQSVVDKFIYALCDPLQFHNRYLDAYRIFEQAVSILDDHPSGALYEALTNLGWISLRFGKTQQAKDCAIRALDIWQKYNISILPGYGSDVHTLMSIVRMIDGHYEDALSWGHKASEQAKKRNDDPNQAMAFYNLCDAYMALEDYDQAYFYIQQAVTICRRLGDRWFMAYCLNHLGHLMRLQGDFIGARQQYQESYQIREPYDDAEGMAVARANLGHIALLQERSDEAQNLLTRAHDLYQTIDDKGGMVMVLYLLGETSIVIGDIPTACDNLTKALQLAQTIETTPRTLAVLSRIGLLALVTGLFDACVQVLHYVKNHANADSEIIDHANLTLHRLQKTMRDTDFQDLIQDEANFHKSLDIVMLDAQKILLKARTKQLASFVKVQVNQSQNQNLIEPLSDREMEVLVLLVDGLSNREIAERLIVAEGTIKTHNYNIYSKLGVRNRLRAVTRARELGLVE